METLPNDTGMHTRRAHPRVVLPAPVRAVLGDRRAVQILDLSPAGARIAHHEILAPGDRCTLRFALGDQPVTASTHLVWSSVVRRVTGADNRPLFNSGLMFTDVPPATQTLLAPVLGVPGGEAVQAGTATAGSSPPRAPSAPAAKGSKAGALPAGGFSEDTVRAAWAWAGRCCECEREGHGHTDACRGQLTWSCRGTNRAGGWEARRRQPAMPGGAEAENCEIVCWLCYQLDCPEDEHQSAPGKE
jgi:hypothetical protein